VGLAKPKQEFATELTSEEIGRWRSYEPYITPLLDVLGN
jgi:hypothetical protein